MNTNSVGEDPKKEEHNNIEKASQSQKEANIKEKVKVKNKKPSKYAWPIKAGVLTLALSLTFGILSEMILSDTNMIIAIIVILVLMVLSIVFDIIGVAFACCPLEPILAMASRKVKGSKEAISLVRNGDVVSSVCSDIIGDICGILSGAAGTAVAAKFIMGQTGSVAILIASVVSAIIAAFTVFGKAMCKKLAIDRSVSIVSFVGRVLGVFTRNKNK